MSSPLPLDDLKKGDWFIITGRKPLPRPPASSQGDTFMIAIPSAMEPPFESNGVPMKVHAISFPFVVAFTAIQPEALTTVDISRYEIRRPTKAYVAVFTNHYKAYHAGGAQIVQ